MILDHVNPFDQEENLQRTQYLTFIIDGEEFGVDIGLVTEIIGMQPVNTLPEVPAYIIGVINHRGKVIPVMDMRLRLKRPQVQFTDRTCILVIRTKRFGAGLIVDQVADVFEIDPGSAISPPDAQISDSRPYIEGICKAGREEILLIDCEKLFENNEPENPGQTEGAST